MSGRPGEEGGVPCCVSAALSEAWAGVPRFWHS